MERETAADEALDNEGTAAGAYGRMRSDRDPYLVRARRMAEVTVPYLFRPVGENGATSEMVPWNTLGAFLVFTNLGPKLTDALFPAGIPPMILEKSGKTKEALRAIPDPSQRETLSTQIDAGLAAVGKDFAQCMDEDGDRGHLSIASLKLLVGGNHGFQFYPDGTMRGISLDRFCVKRDPSGNLLEFCIEDPLSFETLDEDMREIVRKKGYDPSVATPQGTILVYTWGRLKGGLWHITQEVYGVECEECERWLTPEALDYLFVPFILLDGEDYGRSYVEMYEGDLQTVEGGTQTITEGSAAIARFIQFVHPGGLTSKKAVAEAPNGAVLSGRAEDVTTLLTNKGADFQSQQYVVDKAEARLNKAFLVGSRRQGERVTAEEIRADIEELQSQLGSIYSQLVVSYQTPYARIKLAALQRTKRVQPLPKGAVKMTILGGLAALGRSAMLNALDNLLKGTEQLFGPEAVAQALGPKAIRTYFNRRAAALGVNTDGLIPTEAEAAQAEQEAQMRAMVSQLGPEAIKQVGNNLTSTQVADTNASAKLATSPEAARAETSPDQ